MKVRVISVFRDKFTGKVYDQGEVLSFEDEARVEDLTSRKLVEVVEEKKAPRGITLFDQEFEKKAIVDGLKSIGEKAQMNMKDETLIANVAALEEEKVSALKLALGIE